MKVLWLFHNQAMRTSSRFTDLENYKASVRLQMAVVEVPMSSATSSSAHALTVHNELANPTLNGICMNVTLILWPQSQKQLLAFPHVLSSHEVGLKSAMSLSMSWGRIVESARIVIGPKELCCRMYWR